jgi:hypothetical protein
MVEMRNLYTILVLKPVRKRPVGKISTNCKIMLK